MKAEKIAIIIYHIYKAKGEGMILSLCDDEFEVEEEHVDVNGP